MADLDPRERRGRPRPVGLVAQRAVAALCISSRGCGHTFQVRTPRGLERLNAFADAVVAIAITLLILPLVDIAVSYHGDLGALLDAHGLAAGVGSAGRGAWGFMAAGGRRGVRRRCRRAGRRTVPGPGAAAR